MRMSELFEDPNDPKDTPKLRPAGWAPKKKGMDDFEPNTPFAYGTKHKMQQRMNATRQKAKDAGFVKPDGSANTRAYHQDKNDRERAAAQKADREYRKKYPTGNWTRNDTGDDTGNLGVTTRELVPPPKQVHPDDRIKQNAWVGNVMNQRAKTAKARHNLKKSGPIS